MTADIETLAADTRYFAEAAAPSTPSSGQGVIYVKADGLPYYKGDDGVERALANGITEHAYVTGTSTSTITSTSSASPDTVISSGAIDVGDAVIDIEFWCYAHRMADGDLMVISLWEDSTNKGIVALLQNTSGGNYQRSPLIARYRYQPGAGNKTFSIRAYLSAGSSDLLGAGAAGSGNAMPMVLRITSLP